MRRIVRRTTTLVTVQTWTMTWAEEIPAPDAALPDSAPALPPSPAAGAPAPSAEPPALPDLAGDDATQDAS